jgi:hypothetical protein
VRERVGGKSVVSWGWAADVRRRAHESCLQCYQRNSKVTDTIKMRPPMQPPTIAPTLAAEIERHRWCR